MKIRANICGWQLLFIALSMCSLLGLMFGCSMFQKQDQNNFEPGKEWIEDLQDSISENIDDPSRKGEMLDIVELIGKDLKELDRVIQDFYTELGNLTSNYKSTPGAYKKVINAFEAALTAPRNRIAGNRFRLKDLSTSDEWSALMGYREKKGLYMQTVQQPVQ